MRHPNTNQTRLACLSLLALILPLLAPLAPLPARAGSFAEQQRRHPRYRAAEASRAAAVERRFRDAGAAWPPRIYLRAFKLEGTLELWAAPARGDRWVPVQALPICAASGALGPKRQQGDAQVPEGFYTIDRFNPRSAYHLSLGLDYPNAVDRARARPGRPLGGDIFIHGDCVTIGCLPLRDGPMEDIYLAAVAARDAGQARIAAHVFPCRFGTDRCVAALEAAGRLRPDDAATWPALMPAHALFEDEGIPPAVRATPQGYRIRSGR